MFILKYMLHSDFRSHNIMFKHMYREHDIGSDSGGDSDDDNDDGIVIIDSPSPPKSKPGPPVSVQCDLSRNPCFVYSDSPKLVSCNGIMFTLSDT